MGGGGVGDLWGSCGDGDEVHGELAAGEGADGEVDEVPDGGEGEGLLAEGGVVHHRGLS